MDSEIKFRWGQVARDMAVNAVGIFLQGAMFALGGVAVYKLANRMSGQALPEGNVIPIKKTA